MTKFGLGFIFGVDKHNILLIIKYLKISEQC